MIFKAIWLNEISKGVIIKNKEGKSKNYALGHSKVRWLRGKKDLAKEIEKEKLIRKLENEYKVLTAKVRKWLKDEGVTNYVK